MAHKQPVVGRTKEKTGVPGAAIVAPGMLALPFGLVAIGYVMLALVLVLVIAVVGIGLAIWDWAAENAYTHTEEWRNKRLDAWLDRELPSTCSLVGHSYRYSLHTCDWCDAERWLTVKIDEPDGIRQQVLGTEYYLVNLTSEVFMILGERYKLVCIPSRAELCDREGHIVGDAGTLLDDKAYFVGHSKNEARKEAQEAARYAAKRDAKEREYATRRAARYKAPPYKGLAEAGSYPRGYGVTDAEQKQAMIESYAKLKAAQPNHPVFRRSRLRDIDGMEMEKTRW